ncbi:MAG: glycosyltransferase family 4 protein [Chloroflexi bacterium]|nr:glycosyltransferase family 4 protein [Chloroflexota bacterium]
MKLAFFGHKARAGERGGGLFNYSAEALRGLRALGTDVIFLYHGPRTRKRREMKEVQIGSFNVFNKDVLAEPNAQRVIEDTLRAERPDVAHASLSFSLLSRFDFTLPDICHDLGIPIIATLHFPYDRRSTFWGSASRSLYRLYATPLSRYDGVVIFSDEQKALLADYGVSPERLHVIPNGVDTEKYRPGRSDYKRKINAEFLITYMGRLDPEKNVGGLLKVFSELKLPPTHKLIVVGDGTESEKLQERYDRNSHILFTGWVSSEEERLRILQATDIFVLPSDVEGLSLALLEAMACACGIIATDAGADGEVLADTGILIDPEDLQPQLRLAMQIFMTHQDFRHAVAGKARERAIRHYSLDTNIQRLLRLYQHVLDDFERGRAPALRQAQDGPRGGRT